MGDSIGREDKVGCVLSFATVMLCWALPLGITAWLLVASAMPWWRCLLCGLAILIGIQWATDKLLRLIAVVGACFYDPTSTAGRRAVAVLFALAFGVYLLAYGGVLLGVFTSGWRWYIQLGVLPLIAAVDFVVQGFVLPMLVGLVLGVHKL